MKNNDEELECTSYDNVTKITPIIRKKSHEIKHRVINTEKEFDDLETDWGLLSERTATGVFQIYEWSRTWWDHFGAYGELQIFALYDGKTLVGIAPLFLERTDIAGMISYARLRMIGSEISTTKEGPLLGFKSYSDYLQFLIDDDYLESFFEHLSYFLTNEVYFDELLIEEIPEKSSTLNISNYDFSSNGYELSVNDASRSYNVSPEDSWKDYLSRLSSKERNNVRRRLKDIEVGEKNLFRVEEFGLIGDIENVLHRFIELHQKQWNSRGLPGSFAEFSMHRFFMDVSQKLYKNGQLKIKTIQPVGKYGLEHCLGIDINLVYKNHMYGQHRAMDIESSYFKSSPGKTLLIDTIKDAVQARKTFDFLRGEEKYKERLATKMNQNKTIRIRVSSRYRKWTGRILSVYHHSHKTLKVENVRLRVLKNQGEPESVINRYFHSLIERMNRRF